MEATEVRSTEGWAQPPVSGARWHYFLADGRSVCRDFAWLGALVQPPFIGTTCGICNAVNAQRAFK